MASSALLWIWMITGGWLASSASPSVRSDRLPASRPTTSSPSLSVRSDRLPASQPTTLPTTASTTRSSRRPTSRPARGSGPHLVDRQATRATQRLLQRLHRTAGRKILFGHQNATLQGVHWKVPQHANASPDLVQLGGKYPAVVGFDFGNFKDLDHLPYAWFLPKLKEAHRHGAAITFSWHAFHPVTGKKPGSEDYRKRILHRLVPGGDLNRWYRRQLDRIAAMAEQARDDQDQPIPIIFRPFHEQNGDWFWWAFSRPSDYIALWRYTVRYLRDTKHIHNLLYAYSPSSQYKKRNTHSYFDTYPGDDWVDIYGMDCYTLDIRECLPRLREIVALARARGKVAALTETGWEDVKKARKLKRFWTERFLAPLAQDPLARHIAYVMLWRNADRDHHYLPYPAKDGIPAHPTASDFRRMLQSPALGFAPQTRPTTQTVASLRPTSRPFLPQPASLPASRPANVEAGCAQDNPWHGLQQIQRLSAHRLLWRRHETSTPAVQLTRHPLTRQLRAIRRSPSGSLQEATYPSQRWRPMLRRPSKGSSSSPPPAASDIHARVWTSESKEMAAYCDAKGQLHLLWRWLHQTKWFHLPLCDGTGLPPLQGPPQSLVRTRDVSLWLFVQGTRGQLYTFQTRQGIKAWDITNLTERAKAPLLAPSASSFHASQLRTLTRPFLVYRGQSNDLHALEWVEPAQQSKKKARWVHRDLTALARLDTKVQGRPFGFPGLLSHEHHVLVRDRTHTLHLLTYHTLLHLWSKQVLRDKNGQPLRSRMDAIGLANPQTQKLHLWVVGTDQRIHELIGTRRRWTHKRWPLSVQESRKTIPLFLQQLLVPEAM